MKKTAGLLLLLGAFFESLAQRSTANDGNWSQQLVVLRQTAEADLVIRVGDIDNLNYGFPEEYDPFSGRSTDAHPFPWSPNKADARGTDRIMVPTSYKYGSAVEQDGYTGASKRPDNNPISVSIPLKELKTVKMDSASLQLFIDDFQAPYFNSKFQVKLNGPDKPVAPNDTEANRARNRRVEMTITKL